MLPWLLDLGLGVVDLGLAAAAVALVVEGLPGGLRREAPTNGHPGPGASEDDDDET
jgi:hypothetical protein